MFARAQASALLGRLVSRRCELGLDLEPRRSPHLLQLFYLPLPTLEAKFCQLFLDVSMTVLISSSRILRFASHFCFFSRAFCKEGQVPVQAVQNSPLLTFCSKPTLAFSFLSSAALFPLRSAASLTCGRAAGAAPSCDLSDAI